MIIKNEAMEKKATQTFAYMIEDMKNYAFEIGWDFIVDKTYIGCGVARIYAGKNNVIKRQYFISRPQLGSFEIGVKRYIQDNVPDDTATAEDLEKESERLAMYLAEWYEDNNLPLETLKFNLHERTQIRLAHSNFHDYLI